MSNQECKKNISPNSTVDSVETKFLQPLRTLSDKITIGTFNGFVRQFHAAGNKSTFKKYNVPDSICDGLFSDETSKTISVAITPETLIIIIFSKDKNISELTSKDQEASITLSVKGEYFPEGKYCYGELWRHTKSAQEKPEDIVIEPDNYANIFQAIEAIAIKQGSIKQ